MCYNIFMEYFLIILMFTISQYLDYFTTRFMGLGAEGNPLAIFLFKNNLALPLKLFLVLIVSLFFLITKRFKNINRFYKIAILTISVFFIGVSINNIVIGLSCPILNWKL